MNISAKKTLVSSICVIMGLSGSHSHASQNDQVSPKRHKRELMTINTNVQTATLNTRSTINSVDNVNSILLSQQSFLEIQTAEFVTSEQKEHQKKNIIFEFSSKFNDKLQQILEHF